MGGGVLYYNHGKGRAKATGRCKQQIPNHSRWRKTKGGKGHEVGFNSSDCEKDFLFPPQAAGSSPAHQVGELVKPCGTKGQEIFLFSQKGIDKVKHICYNGIVRKGMTL